MAGIVLPEAARGLLESDAVAHVVTIDEDGGPQVTAAWLGLEGDEIVLATMWDQRKLRNLRRDPRVVLSVPSTTQNEWGCSSTSWSTERPGSPRAAPPSCSNGWPTRTSDPT